MDMGSPQRTGTADVVVTVIDVNNQAPTFTQTTFFGTVDEGRGNNPDSKNHGANMGPI